MGKRYEITGRTNVFFSDRSIGDVYEGDLDEITERQLIDAGVIRELPEEKKPAAKPAKSTSRSR